MHTGTRDKVYMREGLAVLTISVNSRRERATATRSPKDPNRCGRSWAACLMSRPLLMLVLCPPSESHGAKTSDSLTALGGLCLFYRYRGLRSAIITERLRHNGCRRRFISTRILSAVGHVSATRICEYGEYGPCYTTRKTTLSSSRRRENST